MNIEALIESNIRALVDLTIAVTKLTVALDHKANPEVHTEVAIVTEKVAEVTAEAVSEDKVTFAIVKKLVGSLAAGHREEIKELNKKYELAVAADLLEDKFDYNSAPKSQEVLEAYYAELIAMES